MKTNSSNIAAFYVVCGLKVVVSGKPIIIDNGRMNLKAGFAGYQFPQFVIPNVLGVPRYDELTEEFDRFYFGDEALILRGVLHLLRPIRNGLIADWSVENLSERIMEKVSSRLEDNWDVVKQIWLHVLLNELRIDPKEHPIMMIVSPLLPNDARERIGTIVLEELDAPSIFLASDSELSLYKTHRSSGVVVDSGSDLTTIVPIMKGVLQKDVIKTMELGGESITEYLRRLNRQRGVCITGPERIMLRAVKENLSYIAKDFDQEMLLASEGGRDKTYMLLTGDTITLGSELFQAPELYYKPELIGLETDSLDGHIVESIEECPPDMREELYANIFLSGGSTMLPGFSNRLELELSKRVVGKTKVSVFAPPNRQFLSWIGGSTMVSYWTAKDLQEKWITRDMYEEKGPEVFHATPILNL